MIRPSSAEVSPEGGDLGALAPTFIAIIRVLKVNHASRQKRFATRPITFAKG
jgi:hypothetical protein